MCLEVTQIKRRVCLRSNRAWLRYLEVAVQQPALVHMVQSERELDQPHEHLVRKTTGRGGKKNELETEDEVCEQTLPSEPQRRSRLWSYDC